MMLIDGDTIITVKLYDDQYPEEFTEAKMSIIDYVNGYTEDVINTEDDILDRIQSEILQAAEDQQSHSKDWSTALQHACKIIDKYK